MPRLASDVVRGNWGQACGTFPTSHRDPIHICRMRAFVSAGTVKEPSFINPGGRGGGQFAMQKYYVESGSRDLSVITGSV